MGVDIRGRERGVDLRRRQRCVDLPDSESFLSFTQVITSDDWRRL